MGHNSLFDYLVRGLGYSEATAYQRQACVRLAREVPEIKSKIDQGSLSLTNITTVYKHIRKKSTHEKRKVLMSIENKSTREVKRIFTEPSPQLKVKKTEYQDKVHLRFELSHEQYKKLQLLKDLRSHTHNLESLLISLVEKELNTYKNTQFKPSESKNPRQISKRLRNHVLKKSNNKCQYDGCEAKQFLQIDHIVPVRFGGNQKADNLQVLCSAHNKLKS